MGRCGLSHKCARGSRVGRPFRNGTRGQHIGYSAHTLWSSHDANRCGMAGLCGLLASVLRAFAMAEQGFEPMPFGLVLGLTTQHIDVAACARLTARAFC